MSRSYGGKQVHDWASSDSGMSTIAAGSRQPLKTISNEGKLTYIEVIVAADQPHDVELWGKMGTVPTALSDCVLLGKVSMAASNWTAEPKGRAHQFYVRGFEWVCPAILNNGASAANALLEHVLHTEE